jgi:hypothetical protein
MSWVFTITTTGQLIYAIDFFQHRLVSVHDAPSPWYFFFKSDESHRGPRPANTISKYIFLILVVIISMALLGVVRVII